MKKIIIISIFLILASCKDQVSNGKNTTQISPVNPCDTSDTTPPVLTGTLNISNDSSSLTAPTITWTAANDNCTLSSYELAIGTTSGADNILPFTNIGNTTTHQQTGLNLSYDQDYFYSLRAVDSNGNKSATLNSLAWQIFTPKTLTNLVIWLDSSVLSSIEDNEGDNPQDINFSNEVKKWLDISGSSALHNFSASSNLPNWDVTYNAVRFNGSNQFMATANHNDINLDTVAQRTLTTHFRTDSDISSKQIIYEEGGSIRGINIYIDGGNLYCGFWNNTNDGDGTQPFESVSSPISTNTKYTVSLIFDYSNFAGPSGVDGTIECVIDQVSAGVDYTTSRLFAHSGAIGIGALNNDSYFHDGPASGSGNYFFKGVIFELLMYNSAHTLNQVQQLHEVLKAKW